MKHGYVLGATTLALLIPTAASAQVNDDATNIIVTGTRVAKRSAIDSAAPIDVLSQRDLGASPSVDLNDKIAQEIPSFTVQRLPGFDGASFVRPASLRNLSPDSTLVLVNGKRRHRSAFIDTSNQGAQPVDLSQIPEIAIGRVEVLRDGASAQYGSDAIAGVINLVLDDRPGTTLNALVSQYYAGDGFNSQLSGRSGLTLGNGGHLVVAGQYAHVERTDRTVNARHRVGQPKNETGNATFELAVPTGVGVEIYAFGTWGTGRSEIDFRNQPVGNAIYRRSFFQSGPGAIFPEFRVADLYPDGVRARLASYTRDAEVAGGIRSELSDTFSWDLSARYGRNRIRYEVLDTLNPSLGPDTPRNVDAGRLITTELGLNADAVWRLDAGLAEPVNVAFGAAYRDEGYRTVAGQLESWVVGPLRDLTSGSYTFPGLSPASVIDVSRKSGAAYLDVELPLTSRLTLGGAGRYEHYDDFGSNWSYRASALYRLSEAVRLRAAASTGFHAPTPGQQDFTKVTQSADTTAPAPYPIITTGLIASTDPTAVAFGGKPLQAERARNLSAGIVLQPAQGLTITADVYRIIVRDRLAITPQITLPIGSAFNRIQFFANAFDTRTRGIDVVGTYVRPAGAGHLSLSAAYSYNDTDIRPGGDPRIVTPVLRDVIERQRPRHRFVGSAAYAIDRLTLFSRLRVYGAYVDALPYAQAAPYGNQRVSPESFVDISASYRLGTGTDVTIGVENLLGSYPDRATSIISVFGEKYPKTRPYDEDGGRYYLRVNHRF